ncbi:MAG: heme ABC exporter ATP-binding protein CcmA [Litorimonas sp.]
MRGKPTLWLDNVSIERGRKTLISELSLELAGPKLLWVVGGNGIGKTSLLRTCAGLSRAASGEVRWDINGSRVTAPEAVSFLPSESYAKPRLKASEDARFWDAELGAVGIEQHAATLTQNLSTGQAKRLSLAKLLSDKKPIWILDEPLAGLDNNGRDLIASHLQSHVQAGGLALVASHAPIAVQEIPTQRLVLG